MKGKLGLFFIFLIRLNIAFGQIEFILDNDQPGFVVQGNWLTKTHTDCYNGTARYIKRGTGNNYIRWTQTLLFPGSYRIEMYLINYKYARDAHCYLSTTSGDSLIIVDQFYASKGWKNLGDFDLPKNFSLKLTDFFADTGTYVYADAIRLTYTGQVFKLGGTIQTGQIDTTTIIEVSLLAPDNSTEILHKTLPPTDRNFLFENIPAGTYALRFAAWGYDTLLVSNIDLTAGNITDLNLTLQPSVVNRYQLTGKLVLDDSSTTALCQLELYLPLQQRPARCLFVSHNQTFTFDNVPQGTYRLVAKCKGYLTDSTSFSNISLNHDINLGTLIMYAYFQFAWYTDIHIGAGTESGFQQVINNINSMKDELDFAFATGDLTEKGLNAEFTQYKGYANSIQLPVYNIPGNHDTKWSESGLQAYKSTIGPLYFSFNHKGFHFIGFNSGTPMKGGYGYFDPDHISWLENDLANLPDSTMPVIFATHFPIDVGGIPNYWKVLDILKRYHTVFVIVGHGHSNVKYDFEGIPGAMGMDTYRTDYPSGFNIIRVSKKEITVTPFFNKTGIGAAWLKQAYLKTIQPKIDFVNLSTNEVVTGARSIQIVTSLPMASGSYSVRPGPSTTPSLSGSGTNWTCNFNPTGLDNGNHTLIVYFNDSTGKRYVKTIQFYVENGNFPKAIWRYNANSIIISTPAYDSTGVYFGTSNGRIHGISLTTGSPLWQPYQTEGAVFSSAAVVDTLLYIGSSDGKLYAISTRSGQPRWTFNAGQAIIAPVVVQDTLLYCAGNTKLYAINLRTRQKVWEYSALGLIESKPAIQNEKIIITSWDRYVHCLNRFNGNVIWRWNRQSSFYYAPAACWPVISYDKVFVVDPMKNLTAINLTTGVGIWESSTPQCWESIGISADKSRVYIRSLDGQLYAFATAPTTQQQLWAANVDYGWDSTPSMPIEKNGAVLSGGKKGFVVSVAAHNGSINWKYWASQDLISTVNPIDGVRVLACALDGTVTLISGDPVLGIESAIPQGLPIENRLLPPYPNPFNNITQIHFTLKQPQSPDIYIYDILGRVVREWHFKELPLGYQTITWDGVNQKGQVLPSGIYFVKIRSPFFSQSRKVILLK